MIIGLRVCNLEEFAKSLDLFRQDLIPGDAENNGGFYLTQPDTLYIDESIDEEIIGQLDKLVCRFEGHHNVLKKYALAKRVAMAWHLES